jgi:hypothetical protein
MPPKDSLEVGPKNAYRGGDHEREGDDDDHDDDEVLMVVEPCSLPLASR